MATCVCGMGLTVSGRATVSYSHLALARHATGIGLEVCRGVVLQLFIRHVVAEREREGEVAVVAAPPTTPHGKKSPVHHLQVTATSGLAAAGKGSSREATPSVPTPPPLG